ncbi:MAG: SUMF1/EgtB/PvdO family nonheme iron enzyme, partial [Kofleriaceae bacterium]
PNAPCDMLGSVLEWTADDWTGKRGYKVVRGASYAVSPDAGWLATIHARTAVPAKTADAELGYRCVKGDAIALTPKPVAPTPKPKPPEPCDGRSLLVDAKEANARGQFEQAIAIAQKALACQEVIGAPQLHAAIVFGACHLGRGAVAKKHFPNVPRRRERQLVQVCSTKGIELP